MTSSVTTDRIRSKNSQQIRQAFAPKTSAVHDKRQYQIKHRCVPLGVPDSVCFVTHMRFCTAGGEIGAIGDGRIDMAK